MINICEFEQSFKKELETLDKIKEELKLIEYDEDDNNIEDNFSRLFYKNISKDAVTYSIGATKLVLLKEEDPNYVLKIPLHGTNLTSFFEGANDLYEDYASDWDYCENEAIKYINIEDDTIKDFFAETIWIKNLSDDMIIYAQEKAEYLTKDSFSLTKKDREEVNRVTLSHEWTQLPSAWIINAIRYYGFEKVEKLFTFFDEHPEYSKDLHNGNVGIAIKDKRPVIFDYSGYRE